MSEDTTAKKSRNTSKKSLLKNDSAELGGRLYADQMELDSDLYKLEVANMRRFLGHDLKFPDSNEFVQCEHVHFFHTLDSSGRKQFYSNPIGGHFHKMEVIPSANPSDPPLVKCVSGPLEWRRKRVGRNKFQRVAVPTNAYGEVNGENYSDVHTHETTYLKSDKVKKRKANTEAAVIETHYANKIAPVAGVQG